VRASAAIAALLTAVAAAATAYAHDTTGHSTLDQTIVSQDPGEDFKFLGLGPGEPYVVREALAQAQRGRKNRRRSLAYFGQITDFQIADEESPARVELIDGDPSGTASSAWRPQEALVLHQVDATVRQLNHFLRSPVRQGNGRRARMVNAVMTGDLADNQQRNETGWVVRLLEGGVLDPNSGTNRLAGTVCAGPLAPKPADDPENYTGVQDDQDYPLGNTPFYDPNVPDGDYSGWPTYEGLLDKAQRPFRTPGLRVPSYVAFGNHDLLVQGNEDANAAFEETATGCVKPVVSISDPPEPPRGLPDALPPFSDILTNPPIAGNMIVPPDPQRQFVDRLQFKRLHDTGAQPDAHGFDFVEQRELRASDGAAAYYDWSPKPGVRFVVLDTLSEGGQTPQSSDGNVDDPQFRWLTETLREATRRDELVVVFGHHATSSLTSNVPDELALPCTVNDQHGHDVNPGCDRDPRRSTPLHLGDDVAALFKRFPHVIAYVAGHSHENVVTPFESGRGGFWEIKSPAIADWPPQHRLIEVMNNRDGTLSIFATMLDHDSPSEAPEGGGPQEVGSYTLAELASIGRVLTYNDPQEGLDGSEGERDDRNVELLIGDPRARDDPGGGPGGGGGGGSGGGDDGRGSSSGGGGVGGVDEAADEQERAVLGGTAGADSGGDLPFTGLALALLALLGVALAVGGRTLRRLSAG
jgi:metallophosphoesterase (TIGR03767 family)